MQHWYDHCGAVSRVRSPQSAQCVLPTRPAETQHRPELIFCPRRWTMCNCAANINYDQEEHPSFILQAHRYQC